MSITAKVEKGVVTLPPHLHLPDGTEVEIVVLQPASTRGYTGKFPTFKGGGVQPGVDLDNSREIRRMMDEDDKHSQLE